MKALVFLALSSGESSEESMSSNLPFLGSLSCDRRGSDVERAGDGESLTETDGVAADPRTDVAVDPVFELLSSSEQVGEAGSSK